VSVSDRFASTVVPTGSAALLRSPGGTPEPARGSISPIPAAKPQANIPILKMPTAKRDDALRVSANRITLPRDANRDGRGRNPSAMSAGVDRPFGTVPVDDTFYVCNTEMA
jgi:hypothetical protein